MSSLDRPVLVSVGRVMVYLVEWIRLGPLCVAS